MKDLDKTTELCTLMPTWRPLGSGFPLWRRLSGSESTVTVTKVSVSEPPRKGGISTVNQEEEGGVPIRSRGEQLFAPFTVTTAGTSVATLRFELPCPSQSERAHRLSTYLRALPPSPPGARRQNSCCEINRGPGSWWVRDWAGEIHRINSWILEGMREFNLSDFWLPHVHSVESFWRVYCRAWWLLCGAVT